MTRLRIGYVNVAVSDLDRSVAFFRDTVGLALKFSDAEFHYAAFDVPGASFALVGSDDPDAFGRHTGIGFVVEDLDSAHAEFEARGVRFVRPPTREPWGGYMATFADPDDNVYYLDQVSTVHGGS